MKGIICTFLLLFTVYSVQAQYTEIINSKRPGFSESPYSIGTNVYQFETGLFYRNSNNEAAFARPKTFGSELFFRYGKFMEQLEFNLRVAYQKDDFIGPDLQTQKLKGLSDLTVGVKYMVYQQEYADRSKEIRSWKRRTRFDFKRLIPSVGVYGGVHTTFIGKDYKQEEMTFKGALLLQNDFTDRLVVLTNLIADNITSENENYSYIVTMTYAIDELWSFFVENQGIYQEFYSPRYQFGTGAAYLYSPNLQIDASIRTNFFENYSYIYFSTGFAWRLDRHRDQIVYKQTRPQKVKTKRKRNGFFSRLFKKKRNN
jgi:hypothetical protein